MVLFKHAKLSLCIFCFLDLTQLKACKWSFKFFQKTYGKNSINTKRISLFDVSNLKQFPCIPLLTWFFPLAVGLVFFFFLKLCYCKLQEFINAYSDKYLCKSPSSLENFWLRFKSNLVKFQKSVEVHKSLNSPSFYP